MQSSIFDKFKRAKKASMICTELVDDPDHYTCKMGFDSEAVLIRTNGFTQKQTVCAQEIDQFLESLGAVKLPTTNRISNNQWVSDNPRVYIFGTNAKEIHIVKTEPNPPKYSYFDYLKVF